MKNISELSGPELVDRMVAAKRKSRIFLATLSLIIEVLIVVLGWYWFGGQMVTLLLLIIFAAGLRISLNDI